jgi:hypothetical protein
MLGANLLQTTSLDTAAPDPERGRQCNGTSAYLSAILATPGYRSG